MKILAENNAFQNIQRCLDKKCSDVHQVTDFIQLCIQIIFYENIDIAGLVPQNVVQETSEIIDKLKTYEIDVFKLLTIDDDENKKNELAKSVSDALSFNIDNILKDCDKKKSITLLPNLDESTLRLIKRGTEAIINKDSSFFVHYNYNRIISFSESSGFFKIINENNLIDKLFEFSATKNWNNSMTVFLVSQMRYLLNKELSRSTERIYAPSVIRGREEITSKIIINNIDSILQNTKNRMGIADTEKYVGNIEMPSLMYYIIDKSKGNVVDMLKITAELRSKFSCVREYIKKYGGNNILISFGAVNEIATEVYERLKIGVPYHTRKIFQNTYAHMAGVGSFTVSSPISDVKTIKRINELNICVEAFTEVIGDMIENSTNFFTKKLFNNCGISL